MVPGPRMVEAAHFFARSAHRGQRYGDEPYIVHPQSVVNHLRRFGHGADWALLAAGYLHDVVEDTPTPLKVLRALFGEDTALLVDLVSNRPGKNRAQRHAATYPNIRNNRRATTLKLADRLANVWASHEQRNQRMLELYRSEHPEFEGILFVGGDGNGPMWLELQRLLTGRMT